METGKMENKQSKSVHASTKSSLPPLNRKTRSVSSHQERTSNASRPASDREECEFPAKVESERRKGKSFTGKRPNTVSGNPRRQEWELNENVKGKNNKSWDRGYIANMSTTSKSNKQIKPKSPSLSRVTNKSNRVDFLEPPGSSSSLSLAMEAQQQTTATMRLLRDALRKKAEEIQMKLKSDAECKYDVKLSNAVVKPNLYPGPSACFFENSYASCLDEIFQAWINLFYLITNLKITMNRAIEISAREKFQPDLESEKVLISQATECVKFFSQLKMKSLIEGIEGVHLIDDPKMKNFQILDFEDRISSSFFSEMETLSKKAKETMAHLKTETQSEVNLLL